MTAPGTRDPAVADAVARAVEVLRAGGLVAFPTETVYGLGADAANADALARLYAVKRRPAGHPVIVHLARAEQLPEFAVDLSPVARALADAFWPGPLTLVARRDPVRVDAAATGGRDTVGLRVPDHPLARALLDAYAGGIAAPSANRFGRVSPTTAAHVRDDLGDDVDLILDGGASAVGVESTIIDVSGAEPLLLRVGGVDEEAVAAIVGHRVARRTAGEVAAPGTLASHYAPRAAVLLVEPEDIAPRIAAHAGRAVGLLMLRAAVPSDVTGVTLLDPPADVDEYARVLYARLRDADRLGLDVLLVVPPPDTGVGAAVRDRLQRAAAG